MLLDHQDDAYALNGQNAACKEFDLVAVTPSTEKLFAQCCEKLDVDVIALDMAHRLPFFVKPKQANLAIERGVYFEIGYSASIADISARKTLISNVRGCFVLRPFCLHPIYLPIASRRKCNVASMWGGPAS